MPVSTGGPGTSTPTRIGWHLVTLQNGDTAVVRWNGRGFVWGSVHAPASPITGINWLGTSLSDFNSQDPQNPGFSYWVTATQSLPSTISTTLISEIDHGILGLKGQPILVNSQGQVTGGTSSATGSDATPTNIIPSPIPASSGNSHLSLPSLASILGFLGSGSFWAGLGMSLAGAVLVAFGVFQLAGVGKSTAIRVLR